MLKEIEVGAICFMIVAQAKKKSTVEQIRSIPVVNEYAAVFPKKVLGLPPSKDVDLTIKLILGADLVLVAPYRMAPIELVELKKQIGDLLEKKFI